MARFARGNIRFNFADMQEKYKKFCQRTFDLQNQYVTCKSNSFFRRDCFSTESKNFSQNTSNDDSRTLSNPDILSTDEGSSGEDSDNEELATKLESILDANKGEF